jgi:hypothetical protein
VLVKFLESIDFSTVPFVSLNIRRVGDQIIISFDSVAGAGYALETRATLDQPWAPTGASATGNGQRVEIAVNIDTTKQFLRLVGR